MNSSNLIYQFELIQAIRNFFNKKGLRDVLTPPMVTHPGMETHIHPFRIIQELSGNKTNYYLHTSPEFHMKNLISQGIEDIFTISYCFRDEPNSDQHRSQFIMLEWYRSNHFYTKIMQDCEELFTHTIKHLKKIKAPLVKFPKNIKFERYTIQDIFLKFINVDILNFLELKEIKKLIQNNFPEIPLPKVSKNLIWEDYFFLLFLNAIEPQLKSFPFIILYEWPYHLRALSTLKKKDPRVCERFELYINGIEICNCYNELHERKELQSIFQKQNTDKNKMYGYKLPKPQLLYTSLSKKAKLCTGIALGVERLLMALLNTNKVFNDNDLLI